MQLNQIQQINYETIVECQSITIQILHNFPQSFELLYYCMGVNGSHSKQVDKIMSINNLKVFYHKCSHFVND